jgi:hypothetical protein
MPSWADLFLACKGFGLFGFAVFIFEFGCFRGLTCDFLAENAKDKNNGNNQSLRPSGFAQGPSPEW